MVTPTASEPIQASLPMQVSPHEAARGPGSAVTREAAPSSALRCTGKRHGGRGRTPLVRIHAQFSLTSYYDTATVGSRII